MAKNTITIPLTDAMHMAAVLSKAADGEPWDESDAETARWLISALLRAVKSR